MQAVVYCRVSSVEQGDRMKGHVSLDVQRKTCVEFAEKNGFEVVEVIEEVCSAKDMNKMSLGKALDGRENITLIFFNVSRFSRNTQQALSLLDELAKRNIRLISVGEQLDLSTPWGKHQFRSLLSEAEYEREQLGLRVKNALAYKKAQGSFLGKVPYGYKAIKVDGIRKLQKDEYEQNVIKFMRAAGKGDITAHTLSSLMNKISDDNTPIAFFRGEEPIPRLSAYALTAGEIADLLNDYGVTKRGKPWTRNSLVSVYTAVEREVVPPLNVNNNMDTKFEQMDLY